MELAIGIITTGFMVAVVFLLGSSLKGTKWERALKIAQSIVKSVVQSTEQLAANANMTSEEKKNLAMQNAKEALSAAGISLPDSVLSMMIEAEVYILNMFEKK